MAENNYHPSFDEEGKLVQPFKNCPDSIDKARKCLSDPLCEDFIYTTAECGMMRPSKPKFEQPDIKCNMTLKSGE